MFIQKQSLDGIKYFNFQLLSAPEPICLPSSVIKKLANMLRVSDASALSLCHSFWMAHLHLLAEGRTCLELVQTIRWAVDLFSAQIYNIHEAATRWITSSTFMSVRFENLGKRPFQRPNVSSTVILGRLRRQLRRRCFLGVFWFSRNGFSNQGNKECAGSPSIHGWISWPSMVSLKSGKRAPSFPSLYVSEFDNTRASCTLPDQPTTMSLN